MTALSVPQLTTNPLPSSSLAFVGTGTVSNLVVTPVGLLTGSNLITVTVIQPGTNASSTNVTFAVVVVPSTVPLFINTNVITINTNSPATPYPSQITVSNVGANIYKVTATLIGFTHTFPSDVSVLLVGPLGTNVMLMSGEGDGQGVSNVRLTFDDAGVTMPANGSLTNGTYSPAASDLNYLSSLPDVNLPFVTNLSSHTSIVAPYGHALGAFTNANPNGVWSLYVYDNNQPDTGVIAGGWSLSIQTIGPMIAPLSPVTMSENTAVTIPLSVGSSLTAASNITITPAASGQVPAGLIASSNLVLSGVGTSNPTLTITPTTNFPSSVTNSNGVATVTLTLSDANTNVSVYSFPLTVLYVDVPPTIMLPVTATNTPANVPLSVAFTTKDVQGSALAVSASLSTNLGTVGITTNAVNNYTLTFTPTGVAGTGVTGLTTVSIVASDTNVPSVSTTNTLPLTVTAGLTPSVAIVSATNTPENTPISVPFTLANVPAGFSRTNIVGIASNTNLVSFVGFTGISSNFTINLTLAPYRTGSSTITIIVTDQYGSGTNTMTLTVTAVEFPPVLAAIADTTTPANVPVNVVLNVTDPATSITNLNYSASVSDGTVIAGVNFSFNGTNEVATIYPVANATGDSAITIVVSDAVTFVYQSFAITVTRSQPGPILAPIADTNTTVNIPVKVTLNVTDTAVPITNLFYSAAIASTNVVSAVNFSFNGTNEIATIVPTTNKTGFTGITINVSDGVSNVYQSFAVNVTRLEFPPTLGPIPDTNTPANTPLNLVLNVTDSATSITNLIYSAGISSTNVIAAVNFSFNGTNEIASIVPATNKIGVSAITITVSDGVSNVYQFFGVTVTAPTPPTLGPITNQYTSQNTAVQVPLIVTSPVTPLANLRFSGSSSNTNVVNSFGFALNGTNEVATITPVANASGVVTLTLSVSDPFSTNSQSFTLQVNPTNLPTLTSTLGKDVVITFTGVPSASYLIQSSTNLTTWINVAAVTADPVTGAVSYTVAVPTNSPTQGYYRLLIP